MLYGLETYEFEQACDDPPICVDTKYDITTICKIMLEMLTQSKLVVGVHRENYTRIVISQNTQWYQDFCSQYQRKSWIYRKNKRTKSKKRPRTIIKRKHTIAALKRMIKGNYSGIYAERLMEIATTFQKDYYQ